MQTTTPRKTTDKNMEIPIPVFSVPVFLAAEYRYNQFNSKPPHHLYMLSPKWPGQPYLPDAQDKQIKLQKD